MILADYHVHSYFSSDSKAKPRDIIDKAMSLGFNKLCFTDHMDYDFPIYNGLTFQFDPDAYFSELLLLKEEYKNRINLLIGIELGLQPYLAPRYDTLMNSYPFDFAIGSSHLVNGVDPYNKEYWEQYSKEEGVIKYLESIIGNVKAYSNFDVYGHLDYVIRYLPDKNTTFSYEKHADLIDLMLSTIINAGKGIELNTSGYKYGLSSPHPNEYILKRYKDMGGEIITIGSDGHIPGHIGYDFKIAKELLHSLNYKYYTVFTERKPMFIELTD